VLHVNPLFDILVFPTGHTVYVYGYGVTEDILRSQFTPYGPIVNISMEVEKNCGFITYEKVGRAKRNPVRGSGSRLNPDIIGI
jgi:hypothetical protein